MDILTHTLSGLAVGTVVASFSNRGFGHKLTIILIAGFAGALPDIDAISLWSGFDSAFGTLFNLSNSGREIYSSKLWYAHHAFFHSIFAGILFALLIGLVVYLVNSKFKSLKFSLFVSSLSRHKLVLIGFVLGFLVHLIEDMPTPSSSWGGVNFFWPSKSYMGGSGDIWWWNNYDIFLIVFAVFIINLLLLIIKRFVGSHLRSLATTIFLIGFVWAVFQIKTRDYDFAYVGHANSYQEYEAKSKEIQQEILGENVYQIMLRFDNNLGIYF